MNRITIAAVFALFAATVCAQEIPPGTALPVTLNLTLDGKKAKSDEPISATLAQDVRLPSGKIRAGSHVLGHVLDAGRNPDGSSFIRVRFDRVQVKGGNVIPVTTSLRVLASPWEVEEAQLPKRSTLRGESPSSWTTVQVGGDTVYRGGGHVMHGSQVVGDPVGDQGVMAELLPVPGTTCANGSGGRRLALWIFGSGACGVYGFNTLEIKHPGDSAPVGDIVLQSKKDVVVHTGSGLLLITTEGKAEPSAPASAAPR